MRQFFAFYVSVLLAASAQASEPEDQLPPPADGRSWNLVWNDEFDGEKLDTSKWTYRPDGKRKGGWWSRKAISLDSDGQGSPFCSLRFATFPASNHSPTAPVRFGTSPGPDPRALPPGSETP